MINEMIIFSSCGLIIYMIILNIKKKRYSKKFKDSDKSLLDAIKHKLDMDYWVLYSGLVVFFFFFLLHNHKFQGLSKYFLALGIAINLLLTAEQYKFHEDKVNSFLALNSESTSQKNREVKS